MKILKLNESGYEEAALGFSLSYNSTIERSKEIMSKYAFGVPGENKFLESIQLWLDVTAPRFWWQEFDTYRVGITKQSESTMHTLCKQVITNRNFENGCITNTTIRNLNEFISYYNTSDTGDEKMEWFLRIKGLLPEGFLQRRIVNLNYKCLQNIYNQRVNHKLPQWKYFITEVLNQIDHPEFIRKDN